MQKVFKDSKHNAKLKEYVSFCQSTNYSYKTMTFIKTHYRILVTFYTRISQNRILSLWENSTKTSLKIMS